MLNRHYLTENTKLGRFWVQITIIGLKGFIKRKQERYIATFRYILVYIVLWGAYDLPLHSLLSLDRGHAGEGGDGGGGEWAIFGLATALFQLYI